MVCAMRKIISLIATIFVVCVSFTGCASVFVPKTIGIGWTLNWSNPISWVIIIVIIGAIIALKIFMNKRKK